MRARGAPCVVVAAVNRNLPFMTGDAEVDAGFFDILLDTPETAHALFAVPNPAIETADHAIGIHASALVKDGGTLQLGIGSVGDAVAHWLRQRHVDNAAYSAAAEALGIERHHALIDREGGLEPFAQVLFASTEMFTWGLMTLIRAGAILRRAASGSRPDLPCAVFLRPEEFYRRLRRLRGAGRGRARM